MRNYLHLLLLFLSINLVAQTDDDCVTALGGIMGVNTGTVITDNTTGYNEEPDYIVGAFVQTVSGYTAFTWSSGDGFFSINVIGANIGDWNISLSQDCDFTSSTSLYQGPFDPAVATEVGCMYLEGGVDYILGYATDSGNEGDIEFEFINPITVSPAANSICADADPDGVVAGGVLITNCEANNITGDLSTSCPLSNPGLCLDLGSGEILWYTFTTDANAEEVTIETNGSAITPQVGLYDGGCAALNEVGCDDTGNATFTVAANSTYWIAVGEATGGAGLGGTFSLDISASLTPLGDDCGVETLTMGTTTSGTTTCASAPTVGFCGLGANDHAVYFDFEVTGIANVDLEINLASSTFTTGTAATNIGFEIFGAACGALPTVLPITGDCSGFALTTLECVPPGLYSIAIGSTDMMAGDYEVTLSQNVVGPANDACANADNTVALNNNCIAVTLSGTTVDACPEPFTGPACPYDMESVVWHEITLPTNAIGIEVLNITGGAGITVFTDNVCPIPGAPFPDANCITTDSPPITGMTGGDSYLIGVSTDPAAESAYTFDVLAIVPPSNDLCGDAEPLADATPLNGSNNCATPEAYCALDALTSHVVWYQYTLSGTDNTGLNVNVTADGASTTPMTGVSVQLFDGCGGALIQDMSDLIGNDDDCNNPLGMDLEYECLEGGTTVWIAVGSIDTEEGDFTITVSEVDPAPANDECDMAEAVDLSATPCEIFNVTGSNQFACPEGFTADGCAYDADPIVWFSITLPSDAVGLEITDLTPGFYATYFTGACGALTFDATAGCFTDAGNSAVTYSAGDVILLGVGSATADEGAFSFNILSVVPPANDLCAMAEDISASASAGVAGTTACATPPDFDYCGLGTMTSHVVYYTYTVAATNNTDLSIEIVGGGTVPTTDISVALYEDCAGTVYNNVEINGADGCTTLGTELEYECVEGGAVLTIAVGSPEGAEGEFVITITEENEGPANDECDMAEVIDLSATPCEIFNVTGSNEFACPEGFTADGCAYDMDPIVWFSITLPTDAVGLEITDLTAGFYTTYFTGACGALTFDGTAGCFTDAGNSAVTYSAGDVILLGVGSTTADEGAFSFNILSVVPPANDPCAMAEDVSATAAAGVAGTTACATPPDFDYCGLGTTDSHVVYYEYTVASAISTDLSIEIVASGSAPTTDISVALYEDCAGTTYDNPEASMADGCNTLGTELNYECVAPGTVLTIAVGSPEGDEGEFTITIIEDNSGTPVNDVCDEAIEIVFAANCVFETVTTDNTGACPETPLLDGVSSCELDQDAVIWFEAFMPNSGVGFEFEGLSGGEYVAVFSGDCTTPVLEDDCLNMNGQILGLAGNATYLIAVALDAGAEGAIEFDIKTITPPFNDLCDTGAAALTDGVLSQGTTACATSDNTVCTLDDNSHVVYYTYTVTATTNTDITIVTEPSDVTTGTGAMDLVTDVWLDCAGTDFTIDPEEGNTEECNPDVAQTLTYLCVPPGTVLTIAVGSTNGMDGDFTITVDEDADGIPTATNDLCDAPEILVVDPPCDWIPFSVSSINACPEAADLPNNCGFDDNPITWYTFDTPAGAASVEINIVSSSAGNPIYTIFNNDCADPNNALPTALVDCESGLGEISAPVNVMPNTTYLLGIGSNDPAGSDLEIEIKINVPPANDEPCNPDPLIAGATTAGTNLCATEDIEDPNCASAQAESSVWYTYTVEPGVTGVEISFPSITATGPMDVLVGEFLAGCAGDLTLTWPAAFTCDAATLTDPITINCIDEGTVLHILVSSEEVNAGEFEILLETIDPDPLCIDNDECDMLGGGADQGVITTDEDCTVISDCNANACAEFIGDCGVEINNVVWYSVTNDGLGEFISASIENADFDEPVIAIFTGSCGALLQVGTCEFGSGGIANAGPFMIPMDGSQYWIAVGSAGAVGGEFDLCIEINSGCVNDEPCQPFDLENGITNSNPASTTGCTQDEQNPECTAGGIISSVWYSFTVPEGFGAFEVVLSNVMISGDVGIQVGQYTDCNNLPDPDAASCEAGDQTLMVPCTPEGTEYYIQIASGEDMDEGDFEITINAIEPVLENDLCSGIGPDHTIEITEDDYCMFVTISAETTDACPEIFTTPAGCDFTEGPASWYEVTIPDDPGIETMDIMGEVIDGFTGNLQIAVLQVDCDDILNGVEIDCASSGGDIDDFNDIPVTPGETYQIVVGSDTADDDGRLNLSIKVDAPPENDNPCPTDVNPPVDLSGNGSHDGSTCCARGANDDPAVDFANVDCSGATDDDAVWYTFTPSGAGDGFYVYVQSAGGADGIMGNTAVEVYSTTDPNGGCTGNLQLEDSSCGSVASEIEIAISLCDPDLIYYIKVASAEDDCGDFNINILERTSDCAADECEDAEVLETITPLSCEDGENILTIDGCLEFACPEDVNVACVTNMGPTVWYQINIDSDQATILVTQVEAEGFEVVWNIWQSTTGSCDDMIPVSQPQPAPEPALPCSDSDGDPANNVIIPIVQDPPGTPATYWISITAIGEITDPNFTLNYAGSLGCIACSGDDSFDCDNGEYEATIDGELVELEDYENFCPGQEVEVCVAFNYNTAGTGNDWLHGIIPTFGSGWDLEASDIESVDLGGGWEWVDADGACATNTSIYDLPNLCTYNNDDGVLQLCNTACDPNCPCEGPLEADSPLPSGWFWNSDGGSTTCVGGSCIPLEQYGVPGGVNVDVDVCFDLVVKSFEDLDGDGEPDEDCEENRDLQIVFQTTSDAVSGCWEDNPCIIDPSITGPAWLINCDTPPDVLGDDAEICNMDMLDIDVTTEDGSAVDIVVEVIDNPGVDGETDFNFTGGFGTIDNTLTNTSGSVEVVIYEVFSVDPTKPCPGITNTIEVTVYPELEIEFNNPLVVCAGESIEVIATPTGGTGNYVDYQWGAPGNETTPSITVTPVTTTTYVITVTDDLGCTGSSEVEVFWNPPVEFELVPSMPSICQNGEETNDADDILFVDVVFSSGTAPYTINWDFDPGFNNLDNIINNTVNSNDQLEIFEETSVAGTYTIFVEVEDANGCTEEAQIEIEVGGAPFIIVQPVEVPCGGTDETVLIDAAAFFTVGPPVTMMELYTCDGEILIFSNNGNSAAWEVDPNEYNCVLVVAIDQNGCQATEEILLDLNAGPEPTLTGASHCVGETSEVSVDDAGNYTMFEWNDDGPSTGSTITADRDTTFIYIVTVTDSEGCTGVASYEVLVDPNPSISLAGSLSYCSGSTTTLTASGGVSYSWVQDATFTEISVVADAVIDTPGDYTVVVTNAEGCSSDSTVTVIEDANLLVTLNTLELCDGDIDTLSAGQSFDIYQWEDGDGNDLGADYFVEVGGGTYCVTVTDSAAGCTGSTCTTITPNISPTVMVSDTVDICREDVGLAPGVILNFNDQVVGGISGTWIDLDFPGVDIVTDLNSVDFTDVNLGVYAFEFRTNTAMTPCEDARDTMYVNVINCTCPSVDVLGPPTLCNTAGEMFNLDDLKNTIEDVTWASTGSNIVTITGGNMVDLSGLAAGTYEFTMTLVNPVGGTCPESNTASFIIVEEAMAEAQNDSVCNADTGNGPTTIDLNTTLTSDSDMGGIWTNADGVEVTGGIFDGDGLAAMTDTIFTYTVDGPAECGPATTEVTISIIDCNCPQVMITDPEAICNDAGTVNLDDQIVTTEPGTWQYVSGGTGGAVPLDAGNVFNSIGLTSGLYVYNYVFDNDPGGDCPSEFPINIIVSNQPMVEAINTEACNTESIAGSTTVDLTQQITGDTGNGSWVAEPGSESIDITDPSNVEFDGQPIGSQWQFTFTAVAVAPCTPASATVIVTVSDCDCPNVDVMIPAPVCNSETTPLDLASLEGSMIGDGNWTVTDPLNMNVALSGTELDLNGLAAGDYELTYTLDPVPAGDCQPDSTVILSVSAQNFATLAMDQEVCVNDGSNGANFIDFTTLVIAGETGGSWADTDGSGVDLTGDLSNVSFEGVDADMAFTFTYTVTSDAPCVEEVYTIEINTNPCDCPLANPMDPTIECSDVGTVDLTQYNNATFPGTWSSADLTITANSVDLTGVAAGVYNLTYTMDNPVTGCPSSWDTSIEVANPASAGTPEPAAIFCEDETEIVTLTDLLTDEDMGGTWTETSGTMSTGGAFDPAGTFDISGQAAGAYTFLYAITGDAPCMDVSESVEVIIEAVPNADAGEDEELDCINTMTTIGGNSSTGGTFTYLWTEAGGAPITDADQAQITVTAAGVYTLVVTNTETMCTNTDEVTITVSDDVPSFELDFSDITCFGENDGTITIVNPTGGNGDYLYSFDGGAFGTQTNFTGLQENLTGYTIVMMDTSGSGCESSQTAIITEPNLLVLDLGPPVQTNLGNEEVFSIADQIAGFDIDNIVWTVGGDVICSDPTCESITIEADQNANVTVEVTYNGGCIADAVTQIQVSQVVDVILPNVFSPNNDGNNEVFYVNSDDVETVLSMRIYDRWGELVFVSENQPPSDPTYGWDGSFKGEPVNPGVFVYVVEVLFINGTTEQIGGDVTIVR